MNVPYPKLCEDGLYVSKDPTTGCTEFLDCPDLKINSTSTPILENTPTPTSTPLQT